MNIFVTGATGVLGKTLVPKLVAAGHTVSAMSRTPENDDRLRRAGAHPVQVDLFDVEALKQVLAGHEAIYHLATKIPPATQIGRRSAWLENDRLRRDGARNLVEAALAVGTVQTIIYPSFNFLYPSSGNTWLDAQATPVKTATLSSTVEAEEAVARFAESDPTKQRRGISLRLGSFYGPEAPSSWEMLDYARKGIGALPGARAGYLPQIWLQDAISALLLALTEPVPSGVYDIVDDEPVTRAQMFTLLAHAVGRKRLLVLPDLLMRLMTGAKYADISRSLRISNRLFKAVSSWQPTVPNARIGWDLMAQMQNK
ncbi:NAD-dependent epimerase/dehydratase family protein [Ktedonobacter racemifer]|uniref:NAD-dependent epimerase/dehydratase n=1 Tax=Ktedonobacter racemifer DSM 44963 TaxID=485913 RepID=D6THK0_KTERA|nr:NAD(P)-dependent oxidoreductase [Ktedonobacter racemifer]EFH89005.1 NAD-dependent epimerase/dehydratase [Ktedonobacter racemifer DSM 44963]